VVGAGVASGDVGEDVGIGVAVGVVAVGVGVELVTPDDGLAGRAFGAI
jgi:hypothetical protein